jgi:hypothetical protein
MSEQVQFIIVVAFGALCFGCGYLVAFIVTRNKWRDEMIRRGAARFITDRQMGMGRAAKETEGVGSSMNAADRGEFCKVSEVNLIRRTLPVRLCF